MQAFLQLKPKTSIKTAIQKSAGLPKTHQNPALD